MGSAVRPASTTPASWDAFTDEDAFVDEVLAELTTMAADGSRPTRSGPKPALTGAALRQAIMAIWCVCFSACNGGPSASSPAFPSARCTGCLPAGPGSGYGVGCSTGCGGRGA